MEQLHVTSNVEWNEADNRRRFELIELDLDDRLSLAGRVELDELESRLIRYVDSIAPLPLEPLRQLHQRLIDMHDAANRRDKLF